jgi:signal transduction histidine kinase
LVCGGTLAAQRQDSVNLAFIDSTKQVLNTQKKTSEKERNLSASIGILYNQISEYDSARFYLNKALNLPGGMEMEGGRLLSNLANSYAFQGKYVEALKYYLEALATGEKLGDKNNIVRAAANAAEAYYLIGNRNRALYYAEQAKRIYDTMEVPPYYIAPQFFYIIGSVYLDEGVLDKAEENMLKAYGIADFTYLSSMQKHNNPMGNVMYQAYGKEGLAKIYLAKKDYVKALEYAGESLRFAEKNGDPAVVAKVWFAFSDIYLEQGQYAESEKCARRALETYPQSIKLYPDLAFNIAAAGLFAGNQEKAYEYFHTYSVLMKKNTDKNFRETMTSMEIQFETEKKQMRILDLERQKILFISTGITGILLALVIWILLRQKIKNEQREKQLIAANAILEWEKKERKRFASDLHDGINGMLSAMKFELNAVEHLQNIRDRLDSCIEMIRRIARGMMPGSLEHYGLKTALEDYCRLFPNVDFHFFGKDRRINERMELTVYYCAYELVNNSFRHSGAESINVQLLQDRDRLALTVQDNGCGFDKQNVTRGSGLKNIRDRITAFNGKMDIVSAPDNGAETTIELKIKNQYQTPRNS